ncbi:MAG: tetratricopeptide repeat-containing serine protease family protein [Microcoleus anatoxicus]|uniref:tetratricopeptide repeat protein n=1 Tax=Microcoleus anatoxicus TaxID=2705319 RepID=UPI003670AB28
MLPWRYLPACTVLALSALFVTGCQTIPINQKVQESTVLIFAAGDKKGSGSGFFIQGPKEVCAVLTAAHVVVSDDLKLRTYDDKIWSAANFQRIGENLDLAVVTFKAEGDKGCTYKPLSFADSDKVRVEDVINVGGFPAPADSKPSNLVFQFVPGNVTAKAAKVLGYGISYNAQTIGGTSGGPVVNKEGLVIAVHGLTDVEVRSLSDRQQASVTGKGDEASGKQIGNTGLKWGIPINSYPKDFNISSQPDVLQNARKWFSFGEGSYTRSDYEGAVAAYEEAIKIKADYAEAFYKKGQAQVMLKNHEDAIKSFDRAIKIKPDYADAWSNKSSALYTLERYDQALKSIDQVTKLQPNDALAWINRADILNKLERYKDAIDSYDQAIKSEPNYDEHWYKKGRALEKISRTQEAFEAYDKATKLDPTDRINWLFRGNVAYNLSLYQEAFQSYDQFTKLNSNDADSWNKRGNSLMQLKEYEKARESYEKSTKIEDNFYDAWTGKCWALNELKQHENALIACEKAIKIDSKTAGAFYLKGVALEGLAYYNDALQYYEKALKISPGWQLAIDGRNRVNSKLAQPPQ